MNIAGFFQLLFASLFLFFLLRIFLHRTALIYVTRKWGKWIEDNIHVYQIYKVPQMNEDGGQENQFYRKVFIYLNSLACLEDCDYTNLLSGKKASDILLSIDDNQTIEDEFLGARVSWKNQVDDSSRRRTFVLKVRMKDKRRILRPYFQHIHTVSDDFEQRRRELKLYMNVAPAGDDRSPAGRWISVPFTHPATFDTIAMDLDLKNKIKSDLEDFVKAKLYYHRLGRVWKRSYLLYGQSGTGKSSFVAAMAKFLCYDVYDIDLSRVSSGSDLKLLLLQTTSKSVIVIEDLDRFIVDQKLTESEMSKSGLLNFMDGIVNSCCGDEKVMIYTMNFKDQIDPCLLRPGRVDVHIHFPLCDFSSFKSLANSYLGLTDHKLFSQVEEVFRTGAKMSPAEIGEIMLVNRSSPSRALKTVITALQSNGVDGSRYSGGGGRIGRLPSDGVSPRTSVEELGFRDVKPVPIIKELRTLYGLLRLKGSKKSGPSDLDLTILNGDGTI